MARRILLAAVVLSAAQLALACGGGDKLDPPVASSIAAASTTNLQAVAGAPVSERPSVIVKDQRGNPVANISVTFASVLGGGFVTGGSQTTDVTGAATVGGWILGTTAGENALTASVTGLTPLTFSATGVAGPAAVSGKIGGDAQWVAVGTAVPVAPMVRVNDANGNPIAGAAVTFQVTQGGGSVVGGSVTTGADGLASPESWTLGTRPGPNTLAVSSGLAPAALFNAMAFVGPAAKLAIVTQPVEALDGVALAVAPVVHVRDSYGNLVETATSSVTASLASGPGTLRGTVTVNAVAGVATFDDLVIDGITTDGTATLSFTASGMTPATSNGFPAYETASNVNYAIDGLHVTQATQTYQGSVPLVAGRKGIIRVFVKASRPTTVAPQVRVRLYRSGSLTQTYTIQPPASWVATVVNEGSLSSSWNVAVPASAIQTGLSILADVDPAGTIPESNETDNTFPASGTPAALDVRVASPLLVTLIPVIQSGNNLRGDVTEANKHTYMEFALRVLPLSSYDAVVRAPYTYNGVLSPVYDQSWNALLNEINVVRNLEGIERHHYGVVKVPNGSGATGLAYIGVKAALGHDATFLVTPSTTRRAQVAAHEWGHNLSRLHINCGNPSGVDLAYPHAANSIGVYGYDIEPGVLRELHYADHMSYCGPLWTSDYTYKAVLDYRAAQSAGGSSSAGPRRSLLVWGRIGPDGVVLEPAFEIDARPSLPERAGPFRIHAVDAAGRDLFNFSFEGIEIDHVPNVRHFAFVVPLVAGQGRPATIRLTANGRESIRRSSLVPNALGNAPMTPGSARLNRIGGARSRLEWDVRTYPMALVRDAVTGRILSFARGGRLDITVPGRELDVTFSDGVNSVRQRVPVAPR